MNPKHYSYILRYGGRLKEAVQSSLDRIWEEYVYSIWKGKHRNYVKMMGNTPYLTKQQKEEIREYWSIHCNRKNIDTISHQFYYNATGRFDVRYIPDALYFTAIDKFYNNWPLARVVDNKANYDKLFPNISQPDIIAKRINGFWRVGGGIFNGDISEHIFNASPSFLKIASNSEGGHGVYYIDPTAYSNEKITELIQSIKGDIIVQKPVIQSDSTARLNPTSVNTIRCLTLLRKDGTPKLYSSCLRMGIGKTKVDNASSGGCVVGIKDDGSLNDFAYTPKGNRFNAHPSSGIVFSTVRLPNFLIVKELVLRMAEQLFDFRLVSWDIALNQNDEPVLIEANLCSGELDFHQLNNGPLFGDDTEDILKEVFHKR